MLKTGVSQKFAFNHPLQKTLMLRGGNVCLHARHRRDSVDFYENVHRSIRVQELVHSHESTCSSAASGNLEMRK